MSERFFLALVESLKEQDCQCAITGGLACVEFGIVEYTQDCDLLLRPADGDGLFRLLVSTRLAEQGCQFRGAMSAPLAQPWLDGGWTAHFCWGEAGFLDVFGAPPRVAAPWWREADFPFASRQTVACMKRTRRPRDWSQATAMGLQLLARGDERGWLHLFDPEAVDSVLQAQAPSEIVLKLRPALALALEGSLFFERVLRTEVEFWAYLDRLRLNVYREEARKYAAETRRLTDCTFEEQQRRRLLLAEELLPTNPLNQLRVTSLVAEAKERIGVGLDARLLDFLPQVGPRFEYGEPDPHPGDPA